MIDVDNATVQISQGIANAGAPDLSRKLQLLDQWEKSLREQQGYNTRLDDADEENIANNQTTDSETQGDELLDTGKQKTAADVFSSAAEPGSSNNVANSITTEQGRVNTPVLQVAEPNAGLKLDYQPNQKSVAKADEVSRASYREVYSGVYENTSDSQVSIKVLDGENGLNVYIRDYRLSEQDYKTLTRNFRALAAYNNTHVSNIKINGEDVLEQATTSAAGDDEQIINRLF